MNENARNPGRTRLLAVGLLTPVLLIVALGLLAYRLATESVESFNWVTHTYSVIEELDATVAALVGVETAQRGYVITGRENYLEPDTDPPRDATNHLARLHALVFDNPSQRTNLLELTALAGRKLARSELVITTRQRDGFAAAVQLMANDEGKILMDEIRAVALRLRAEELRLLAEREAKYRSDADRVQLSALAFVAAALLVLLSVVLLLIRLWHYHNMVSVGAWTHHTDQGGKGLSFEIYLKDRLGDKNAKGVPPEALRQVTQALEAWSKRKEKQ
jgi:CHASE3 domain sensor protein